MIPNVGKNRKNYDMFFFAFLYMLLCSDLSEICDAILTFLMYISWARALQCCLIFRYVSYVSYVRIKFMICLIIFVCFTLRFKLLLRRMLHM